MNYITTAQAAKKWGITANRVFILAKEGRIPNAIQISTRWMIPENAEKPVDARTTRGKRQKAESEILFRYPNFEYKSINSFTPPLSKDELKMKRSAEAFWRCNFEDADEILSSLPETAENKYIRIFALREGCMIDLFLGNIKRFMKRYSKLKDEFLEDFPKKKELAEIYHELNATLGDNEYYLKAFKVHYDYAYDESFLSHLLSLTALSASYAESEISDNYLNSLELQCSIVDKSENFVDIQSIHIYLGACYAFRGQKKEMTFHFRRALELAQTYNLYYVPCVEYYYLKEIMGAVLKDFPDEFIKKMNMLSEDIHKRYVRFMNIASANSIYKLTLSKNFIYILYAVKGYSNKEVAEILNFSESTVGKKYSEIYSQLEIKSKGELIDIYLNSVKNPINNPDQC